LTDLAEGGVGVFRGTRGGEVDRIIAVITDADPTVMGGDIEVQVEGLGGRDDEGLERHFEEGLEVGEGFVTTAEADVIRSEDFNGVAEDVGVGVENLAEKIGRTHGESSKHQEMEG